MLHGHWSETAHLPLPLVNTNIYFSLWEKCCVRGEVMGSFPETYNDPLYAWLSKYLIVITSLKEPGVVTNLYSITNGIQAIDERAMIQPMACPQSG